MPAAKAPIAAPTKVRLVILVAELLRMQPSGPVVLSGPKLLPPQRFYAGGLLAATVDLQPLMIQAAANWLYHEAQRQPLRSAAKQRVQARVSRKPAMRSRR